MNSVRHPELVGGAVQEQYCSSEKRVSNDHVLPAEARSRTVDELAWNIEPSFGNRGTNTDLRYLYGLSRTSEPTVACSMGDGCYIWGQHDCNEFPVRLIE